MESKNITTNDLRLGNWLYYTEETKFPMQVSALGKDWVQLNFEGNESDCFENNGDEVYPIPFTDKLLLTIGTYVNPIKWCIDGYGFSKCKHNDGSISISLLGDIIIGKNIIYVHELQNLYHALTGEELEIRREWL
mgnify:CR=1 FL=1